MGRPQGSGMLQNPAAWERSTGADTLASLINADLRRQKPVAAAASVGVIVTDGDVADTFLPQMAFDGVVAAPEQHAVKSGRLQPSSEERAARARGGKKAHAEIERSLATMQQVTELPVPQLATTNDSVRPPLLPQARRRLPSRWGPLCMQHSTRPYSTGGGNALHMSHAADSLSRHSPLAAHRPCHRGCTVCAQECPHCGFCGHWRELGRSGQPARCPVRRGQMSAHWCRFAAGWRRWLE